jgi:hypothetical protein
LEFATGFGELIGAFHAPTRLKTQNRRQHFVGRERLPTVPSWLVSAGDMHGFFIVDPNNWPAFCFASSP